MTTGAKNFKKKLILVFLTLCAFAVSLRSKRNGSERFHARAIRKEEGIGHKKA
ncbi:hypothetical protein H704_00230 [Bartonella bacilliformis Peru38]|uniref:Lipoprotein n=1 Tax=Bartonella bacilliformis INS TaxID=1206782 RepID=A0ABN0IHF5_BARBA|nr:hypothetical protein BbINS_01186 [Bartonella bacilliformis INS]EYS89389.1 hypothetical protein X472_00731 [Bartonella bacilliformis San Pedro600-02]KEG21463.1 hypothetical protein H704_00230 [Bartonella bacilliformis Peru38]